jgi:hypothetical protein
MAASSAPPEAKKAKKSGVEVHWQSKVETANDGLAFMCMNELGADVFLKPMLKQGAAADSPMVRVIELSYFFYYKKT